MTLTHTEGTCPSLYRGDDPSLPTEVRLAVAALSSGDTRSVQRHGESTGRIPGASSQTITSVLTGDDVRHADATRRGVADPKEAKRASFATIVLAMGGFSHLDVLITVRPS